MHCLQPVLDLKFLDFATHFSPEKQSSISLSGSQSEAFHLYKGMLCYNICSCSLRQYPDIPVMRKRCFLKASTIKHLFFPSVLARFNLSKSQSTVFHLCQTVPLKKCWLCTLHQKLDNPMFHWQVSYFWYRVLFELTFLGTYGFDLVHEDLSRKLYFCSGGFYKSFVFPMVLPLDSVVQNFHKSSINIDTFNIRIRVWP